MIRFNHREFETREDVTKYRAGFCSYPRWPQVLLVLRGVVGVTTVVGDAPQGSIEAMGWYDAESEHQERMDRC